MKSDEDAQRGSETRGGSRDASTDGWSGKLPGGALLGGEETPAGRSASRGVCHVLLLDDDPDHSTLLEMVMRKVEGFDFRFTVCRTTEEADARLEEAAVDLAVVDYWIHGEPSDEWLSRVGERLPGVPVIVTSSAGDEYIAAEVTRLGASRYLRKDDITPERLSVVLREALDEAAAERERTAPQRQARERLATLTPRERQVLFQVVRGLLTKEIAAELGCAEGTVKIHRSHIMEKTGAGSLAAVVRLALESGAYAGDAAP